MTAPACASCHTCASASPARCPARRPSRTPRPPTASRSPASRWPAATGCTAPAQVLGLDAGEVQRCFPRDGTRDHEPNLFAHVELRSADLPWRFTPGGPVGGKLRPWLVLVVVEDGAQATLATRTGGALPVLTAPVAELPSLADSWAWAHVQLAIDDAPPDDLAAPLRRRAAALPRPARLPAPARAPAQLHRLPRAGIRRRPRCRARPGRERAARRSPTRGPQTMQQVTLPVYHSWHFRCGARATSSRWPTACVPRVAPPDLGVAPLDVRTPGLGLPAVPTPLRLVGALVRARRARRANADRGGDGTAQCAAARSSTPAPRCRSRRRRPIRCSRRRAGAPRRPDCGRRHRGSSS